ncbi:MAG TPA: TIGR01459 family HAD-type hydrolase [Balneola sp.]|jgi:HAD superfamily hydrolase (TIGR01450 family)|nr:TIGR01459 family HAD-type hydrolase [Balneola sp.]MBF64177.1 TIGR01459 family HAD-type hydrolase [Balneola sp.]HBZ40175.1 TIGR01459 family HAD-type hydrolase [Balneola sp.]HCI70661.1 TIGR01459 family HAD-type hydrolase [Balneola sp.]HCT55083.1 TIGR01459 family HAD-type hydrolase [Balneola sp.]|tara:strand:- start:3226 stop:4071 length:846 start_codon:yes stop_codon:yes gene_type:complete
MSYPSFFDIAKQFKVIMLDSYGVVKNHNGLINGADKTLAFIRNEQKLFRILTNDASRSPQQQVDKYVELGLPGIHLHEMITSGMMAKHFLEQKITSGKIAYLGTENSADYILQAGLEHIAVADVDLNNIDDISACVFLDDEGFDWNIDINKVVNLLRKKNMPVILANSDYYYPVSHNDIAIATGGVAKLVENMLGKKFIHFGKPDSQMFMYAYEQLIQDEYINKNDILMVGDTLRTDILGGNKFGVKTMLVLSGNTREDNYESQIRSTGIIPDFVCKSIME